LTQTITLIYVIQKEFGQNCRWLSFDKENGVEWDLFISYASEDKDEFVRPLVDGLVSAGLKIWYDDFSLKVGDSLRRSIDEGLAKSKYGVVVLSPSFFNKEWPRKELDGLVSRERNGIDVILPIWHKVDTKDVLEYSPILAERVAAKSSEGIDRVIDRLLSAIKKKNGATIIDNSNDYRDISEEEVDILISALSHHGVIYILETDQTGPFLSIGNRDYFKTDNPEIRISCLEALKKLIELSLVFQEDKRLFSLTKAGFQYAENLEINTLKEKAWHLYENVKNYSESINLYRNIVSKYPESGTAKEAQKMIGVNYLHLDNSLEAEMELKKALNMGNDFSSAYFYYGEALLRNKKYKEAKMAYEDSLSKLDVPEWIKTRALGKIILCQKGMTAMLAALADEKYEIEKDKINKEIPLQEANLKEKAGLLGQRWSSGLARKLLELNLAAAKKKIETKLRLDKEIVFSSKKVKTVEAVDFLIERLRTVAESEKRTLKEKIEVMYKDCHANSFIDVDKPQIDNEINTILKEKHTDLMIELEQE